MVNSLYTVIYRKKAILDIPKLKAAKLADKAQKICDGLIENPTPPNSKKLLGNLANKHSIRINLQHRLVYEIFEDVKIVKIIRMWSHYEE